MRAVGATLAGAHLFVANPGDEENGRIDIFDGLGQPVPGSGFNSSFDDGDAIAIGNVTGNSAEEIAVADVGFDTAYDGGDDELALGDINNDGRAEVIVANSDCRLQPRRRRARPEKRIKRDLPGQAFG